MPTPLEQKTEAAVQRVVRFVNSFPRPTPTALVKTADVRRALVPLRPLADKVAGLSIGARKGSVAASSIVTALLRQSPVYLIAEQYEGGPAQPATGYLSGSALVTASDVTTAKFVLAAIDGTLPSFKVSPLDPVTYATVKQQAHRLLLIATDLDLDTTCVDQAALLLGALKETLKEHAAALALGGKKALGVLEIALIATGVGAGIYAIKTVLGR